MNFTWMGNGAGTGVFEPDLADPAAHGVEPRFQAGNAPNLLVKARLQANRLLAHSINPSRKRLKRSIPRSMSRMATANVIRI